MTKNKEEIKDNLNLEKLISDYKGGKYKATVLAMQWANHLKFSEEFRTWPMADIIEKALKEVLSGEVTREEIIKAVKRDEEIKTERAVEKKTEKKEKKTKKSKDEE
ncbi:MAG: hypothetical protein GX447_01885 [Elusimicrobia bacterium]|nr:hypothetical protein [Elusimicrobiota bacterium]